MIKTMVEWLWVVLAAAAAVWGAVRAGIITLHLGPHGHGGVQLSSAAEAELDEAEEAHGERVQEIKADADAVRSSDADDIALEFDRQFGAVQKVDPFEPRADGDVSGDTGSD
jgi:hypothetical protein